MQIFGRHHALKTRGSLTRQVASLYALSMSSFQPLPIGKYGRDPTLHWARGEDVRRTWTRITHARLGQTRIQCSLTSSDGAQRAKFRVGERGTEGGGRGREARGEGGGGASWMSVLMMTCQSDGPLRLCSDLKSWF